MSDHFTNELSKRTWIVVAILCLAFGAVGYFFAKPDASQDILHLQIDETADTQHHQMSINNNSLHALPSTTTTWFSATDKKSINDTEYDRDLDLRNLIFGSKNNTQLIESCYNSLPLFIESGSHHKTGHKFSAKIATSILRFCGIKYNPKRHFSSQYDVDKYYFQRNSEWPFEFPNTDYFISHDQFLEYESKTNISTQIILLHYIRSPLNTIISGFNYHTQCPEEWTRCSMSLRRCTYHGERWIKPIGQGEVKSHARHHAYGHDRDVQDIHMSNPAFGRRLLSRFSKNSIYNKYTKRLSTNHSHDRDNSERLYGRLHERSRTRTRTKRLKNVDMDELFSALSHGRGGHIRRHERGRHIRSHGHSFGGGYNHTHSHRHGHKKHIVNTFQGRLPKYKKQSQYTLHGRGTRKISRIFECYARNKSLINDQVLNIIQSNQLSVCQLYTLNNSFYDISDRSSVYYTIIQRLYFELVRYINCEFDSTYTTHELIKNYKYGYEFSMEYYTESIENYDQWLDNLLNILGFKIDETIYQIEYYQLKRKLQQFDLNRMSKTQLNSSVHITRNNQKLLMKNFAIDGLLSFAFVNDDGDTIHACNLIKYMTIKLDYKWQYDSYC